MLGWFRRLYELIWEPEASLRAAGRITRRVLRYVYALLRDLVGGQLTLRATGLVYVTILALVPVLAISFSVLKAFGVHRQLEPLLRTWLVPLGAEGAELSTRIIGFVDNVQGNVLAGVGLVLLFVTTVSMAQRVEDAFNFIWRVDRPRNLGRRFSDYLSVILVGPVILVTALGLIASLESSSIFRLLDELGYFGGLVAWAGLLTPYILVGCAFSFVYWFIPNTRVSIRAALLGGLVGGSLWAAAGVAFTRFVLSSAQTLGIYATFAIVIFALLWLYLSWLTLLIGAQLSFYIQYPGYMRLGYTPLSLGGRYLEHTALSVMLAVATAFRDGGPRPTSATVCRDLGIPAVALNPVLARLERGGLLVRSESDELLPNRDPDQVTVAGILSAVRESQPPDVLPEGAWPDEVRTVMARVAAARERELDGMTLGSLAATTSSGAEPGRAVAGGPSTTVGGSGDPR